jgi:hypothetical protein
MIPFSLADGTNVLRNSAASFLKVKEYRLSQQKRASYQNAAKLGPFLLNGISLDPLTHDVGRVKLTFSISAFQ